MNAKSQPSQLELFKQSPSEKPAEKSRRSNVKAEHHDQIPDVRDGLTREQRVILYTLYEAEKERPGKSVPTAMLYGRVLERMPISKERFQKLLSNLVGRGTPLR